MDRDDPHSIVCLRVFKLKLKHNTTQHRHCIHHPAGHHVRVHIYVYSSLDAPLPPTPTPISHSTTIYPFAREG